ncbi:unnamed protein product [Periconia digitata]|uniref:Uncharacterized protein n=1 Tax=Periconia digitata TaxID=1303443 RepID=A0A9W4UQF9_9PLEO|nr:unnamed protein product [Periconia digitata]
MDEISWNHFDDFFLLLTYASDAGCSEAECDVLSFSEIPRLGNQSMHMLTNQFLSLVKSRKRCPGAVETRRCPWRPLHVWNRGGWVKADRAQHAAHA